LTLPWAYSNCVFLIPAPVETANINAIVKPFQWQVGIFKELPTIFQIQQHLLLFDHQVWLGLGVSIVCVIAVLNLIQRYLEYRSAFEMDFKTGNKPRAEKWRTGNQYLYVFGNLLSQGCFHNIVNYSSITASHSSHV
jgi:hypothetical protein